MSSETDKQLKLGESKKVKKIPVTERTEVDHNTWVLPNDADIVKEAIEIAAIHERSGIESFYFNQSGVEYDFAIDSGTLLWTNYHCAGCGKEHNATINRQTAEITYRCTKTYAIFKIVKDKKTVQVEMICPECNITHSTVPYTTWKNLPDKRCPSCQQEAAAEKEEQRKKVKESSKSEENTTEQATQEITSLEAETRAKDKANVSALLKERYTDSTEDEEEQEEVQQKEILTAGDKYLGPFTIINQDFGPKIIRLDHLEYQGDFYLTTMKNLLSAMQKIFHQQYWSKISDKKSVMAYIRNQDDVKAFSLSSQTLSSSKKEIPQPFADLTPENWLTQLFSDYDENTESEIEEEKEFPRGNKEEIEEFFDKAAEQPDYQPEIRTELQETLSETADKILSEEVSDEDVADFLGEANKAVKEVLQETKDSIIERTIDSTKKPEKKQDKQLSLDRFTTLLIPTKNIVETDFQFRSGLDQEHVEFLKDSMNQKMKDGSRMGNVEAVIVRPLKNGKYEIISGHHRVAAAKAGDIAHVKCEVLDVEQDTAIEVALISNFTRKEMKEIEEARAIAKLKEITGLSHERIGKRLGKSKSWVSHRLALLEVSEDIQEKIDSGDLSQGHVKAVLGLPPKKQEQLLKKAAKEGTSVANLEYSAKTIKDNLAKTERAEEAAEKFDKYIKKNLKDLQEKVISSTNPYTRRENKPFDYTLNDLLEKAKLKDYMFCQAFERKPFLKVLKDNNLNIVDGGTLLEELEREEKEAKKAQEIKEKEIDPCKTCNVKVSLFGKEYCAIADLTKKQPGCKFYWERKEYNSPMPKKSQKFCSLCTKDILAEQAVETFGKYYKEIHTTCYHDLIQSLDSINFKVCETCLRRGMCKTQKKLLEIAEKHNFKIKLDFNECNLYTSEDSLPTFTLKYGEYYVTLFDDFGDSVETLIRDIATYMIKNNVSIEQVKAAENQESEAQLELLQEELSKRIKLSKDEQFSYILSFDEEEEEFILEDIVEGECGQGDKEDLRQVIVEEALDLASIKPQDEKSKQMIEELREESSS